MTMRCRPGRPEQRANNQEDERRAITRETPAVTRCDARTQIVQVELRHLQWRASSSTRTDTTSMPASHRARNPPAPWPSFVLVSRLDGARQPMSMHLPKERESGICMNRLPTRSVFRLGAWPPTGRSLYPLSPAEPSSRGTFSWVGGRALPDERDDGVFCRQYQAEGRQHVGRWFQVVA